MLSPKLISIIIPIFNNEDSLNELLERLFKVYLNHIRSCEVIYQLILVDDGSKDDSFCVLEELIKKYSDFQYRLIKLTRNFGSYNSFLAGMDYSTGDCCVYLHADLQDPPELIPQLFEYYQKGIKLVIANREEREDGSIFSSLYHWIIQKYGISNIPPGGFDLMLFDKSLKDEILKISEKNTNNVYLISWLGYPYVNLPYVRKKRLHGKSQWAFKKKVSLFVDSVFSFTKLPIYALRISLLFSLICLLLSVFYVLIFKLNYWGFILFFSLLIIFILLLNISILTEYVLRIHETVRNRPNFVVEKIKSNFDTYE